MKKISQPVKKIETISLKVIDKKSLNAVYGGNAPSQFTSLVNDFDVGNYCSLISDVDSPSY